MVAGLEQKGIRCWIAPRDVTPGTSWGDAIIGAIEGCKIMVVILSANSNQSRQVVREVERAVANGVIIIPFRIEKIDPTGAMAYFLSTEHWLDAITPPLEEHIEKLGSTVQLFLAEGSRPVVAGRPGKAGVPHPAPAQRRHLVSFIVVILLGIIALAALGIWLRSRLLSGSPTSPPASSTVMEAPAETALPPTPTATVPPTPTEVPPPEFKVIGEYRTSGSANGLFVVGNRLHLANGGNGLLELDVSDQANPILIETYQVGDLPAQSLFVDGEVAYVITGDTWHQLVIMSLETAGQTTTYPAEGTSQVTVTGPQNITVADDLAHLSGHDYWGILDVSDPMQYQEIWTWEPPEHSGTPCNAAVEGSLAFIGCGWAGLFIFDIINPQNPELLGRFETPDWIIDIAVAEDVLYLTLGNSGLLSLDVSEPARPLLLSRLNLPGYSNHLSVAANTLYVLYIVLEENVIQESGVRAVNVSDPEDMEMVATYDKLEWGLDVQALEEDIYVADEARGIIILHLDIIE